MKDAIISHQNNPHALETLYRSDKQNFRRYFLAVYPELQSSPIAECWKERLQFDAESSQKSSRSDWTFLLVAALLAGLLAKLPALLSINEEFFYPRNIGFIVFPFLAAWFARENKLSPSRILAAAAVVVASALFINLLPADLQDDTMVLSCIHLVVVLWFVLAFSFVGNWRRQDEKRLNFLQFNGDLLVMCALIVIAGGIVSGVTMGLFSLIGLDIHVFYMENIVFFTLPAVPIFATWLTQSNPQLVGKISPVIARIFSPVVLVMLIVYLGAMFIAGKEPYTNREFLIIFNVLLIGVMALIFFSVAGSYNTTSRKAETWILFLLSVVTIVVNGIALSAILFRISEWGFTPNRTAVLGSNVLILINLLWVSTRLFQALRRDENTAAVGRAMVRYLPVYLAWAVVVTFVFPFLFGFK